VLRIKFYAIMLKLWMIFIKKSWITNCRRGICKVKIYLVNSKKNILTIIPFFTNKVKDKTWQIVEKKSYNSITLEFDHYNQKFERTYYHLFQNFSL
jgi:hypothetical protein